MNKTELINQIQEILLKNKIKNLDIIMGEIKPLLIKQRDNSDYQTPRIIDDIEYYLCRYSQKYFLKENMVFSNEKSKGYSKIAISKWTKSDKQVKKIKEQALELFSTGNIEEAQNLLKEAEELSNLKNQVEFYNEIEGDLRD